MQAGGAAAPEASSPGAQASAAQARVPVGGNVAGPFGSAAGGQGRNAPSVIANPEGGLLSVRATSRQHEKVQEFLDIIMTTAKRQVLIEATIIEVAHQRQQQTGARADRTVPALGRDAARFAGLLHLRLRQPDYPLRQYQRHHPAAGIVRQGQGAEQPQDQRPE
jgi:hypothetical protein